MCLCLFAQCVCWLILLNRTFCSYFDVVLVFVLQSVFVTPNKINKRLCVCACVCVCVCVYLLLSTAKHQKVLEQRLAQLEESCRGKESERVDLELRLTVVKENLKKSLAGGILGGPTEGKPSCKVLYISQCCLVWSTRVFIYLQLGSLKSHVKAIVVENTILVVLSGWGHPKRTYWGQAQL